jgi:hypothetical protein
VNIPLLHYLIADHSSENDHVEGLCLEVFYALTEFPIFCFTQC